MSPLAALLRQVSGWLGEEGVHFALVGGLAVSARTEPRFTRDVDLALTSSVDADAEDLARRLASRGLRPVAFVEQDDAGRLSTVRLRTAGDDGIYVDLLFASSGIEPEIVAAATALEIFREVRVPVATTGHLVALKLLSVDRSRPKDLQDLAALRGEATADDHSEAERAVRLITERGFHRGRDLEAALASWWNS